MNLQRSYTSDQQILKMGGCIAFPADMNLLSDKEWLDCCAVAGADPSRFHIPHKGAASKTSKSTPSSPSNNRKLIDFLHPASPVAIEPINSKVSKSHPSSPSIKQKNINHHPLTPCNTPKSKKELDAVFKYPDPPLSLPIEPIRTSGGAMTNAGKSMFPPLGASKHPDPLTSLTAISKKELGAGRKLFVPPLTMTDVGKSMFTPLDASEQPNPLTSVTENSKKELGAVRKLSDIVLTMSNVGKSTFTPLEAPKQPIPLTPVASNSKKELGAKLKLSPLTPPFTPKSKSNGCETERLLIKEIEYHRWEMEDLLNRAEDAKEKKLFLAEAYYGQMADLHFQAIEKAGAQGDASNKFCPADR